ncbi:MAG: hypothetical protein QM765_20710 [Myxococcales bacterium]
MAAAGTDGALRTFDARDGTPRGTFAGNGWVNDLDFRADRIAMGGRGKEIRVYDASGALVRVLPYGRNVERVSLSYDGKRCVASSGAKTAAMVWNVDSGQPMARLDAGEGVRNARFSCARQGSSGYLLAGCAGHSKIATWEIA